MTKNFLPFLLVLLAFLISIILVPVVGHNFNDYVGYLLFVIFVIELPIVVVMSRDVLFRLNTSENDNVPFRLAVRTLASIPSFVFGATSVFIGLAIVGWVLYNVFIETLPAYTGHMLLPSLGIGPILVYWGYSTLKSIFGFEEKINKYNDCDDDELH